MFLTFVVFLLILNFVLRNIVTVLTLPITLILVVSARRGWVSSGYAVVLAVSITLCGTLAAFFGAVSKWFAFQPEVTHHWLYGATGFVFTYVALGRNAESKFRALERDPLLVEATREEVAAAHGAGVGLLLGLIVFPVAFFFPNVIRMIPGSVTFLDWAIRASHWIFSFDIIKFFVVIGAVGFLLYSVVLALATSANIVLLGWSALRGLWRKDPSD